MCVVGPITAQSRETVKGRGKSSASFHVISIQVSSANKFLSNCTTVSESELMLEKGRARKVRDNCMFYLNKLLPFFNWPTMQLNQELSVAVIELLKCWLVLRDLDGEREPASTRERQFALD